jgi:hypothetical protein
MAAFQGLPIAAAPSLEAIGALSPAAWSPVPDTLVWNPPSRNIMTVFGSAPLASLQIMNPEPEAAVTLSSPAVTALILGAVLLTFLVWWVTDRLGHRDLVHMHEFHKHSLEFQKAADEAVLALKNDYDRVKPLLGRMNYHLGSMRTLRRDLQAIHRFRLDTGGDDPRILRALDEEIEEGRKLIEALSEAYDRQLKSLPTDQHGNVVRLSDRRKDPNK